jgi:transglutaminase-like putative cysteine protease
MHATKDENGSQAGRLCHIIFTGGTMVTKLILSLICTTLLLTVPLGATLALIKPKVRAFEFTYMVEVKDIPANAGKVAIWLPYPTSDANQEISDVQVSCPYPTSIHKDPEYGNSILYVSINHPKEASMKIEMKFTVRRAEYLRNDFTKAGLRADNGSDRLMKRWLMPDRLVPIDDKIKAMALEVTKGKTTDLEKARSIYDFAVANLKYDKSGTGWGRGDIYYACDVKHGNCTDFHAVFIGFCRAVGIPAKFAIGFPLPEKRGEAEIGGYHCWAEFYLKGYGWVPVDASEASKNLAKKEYFFGAHDENRVQFTIGRDIVLNPPQSSEPLNYFIYPYVEVDGEPFNGVQKKFSFKDLAPHETAQRVGPGRL